MVQYMEAQDLTFGGSEGKSTDQRLQVAASGILQWHIDFRSKQTRRSACGEF